MTSSAALASMSVKREKTFSLQGCHRNRRDLGAVYACVTHFPGSITSSSSSQITSSQSQTIWPPVRLIKDKNRHLQSCVALRAKHRGEHRSMGLNVTQVATRQSGVVIAVHLISVLS